MGTWARNSTWKYIKCGKEADDILVEPPSGKKTIDSTAEVDVAAYATAQVVDANLTAENIKKDVVILGQTGSYEGGGSSDFFIATVEDDTLDKTWQEVSDALDDLGDGKVWIVFDYTAERVKACNPGELLHESWTIDVYSPTGETIAGEFLTEDGPDAYPVLD